MRHLEESTILAVRDGEDVGDAARDHLERCATCAAALTAARARAESIDWSLTALDRPVEPTAAKAGVRARTRRPGDGGAPRRWGAGHLGRAAALLLVTAGAAAALPGSPLRSLWSPSTRAETAAEPTATGAAGRTTDPASERSTDVGITVAVADGVVHVVVRGALPGTELSVSWSAQSSARVTAPPGSRFTYAAGRVEVDASRGPIRIELPRQAGQVSLEVDGRLYLEGSPDALTIPGPAVELTEDTIRFQVTAG